MFKLISLKTAEGTSRKGAGICAPLEASEAAGTVFAQCAVCKGTVFIPLSTPGSSFVEAAQEIERAVARNESCALVELSF